eukprot:CAMPEP_0181195114 /NCGR_PEP_ID=MMETSP1096-20121128/14703_1 /TAXON_ID=156174 ORGANISM="Chrysochromulina ericina, Strain CCMP281" /NCGR_SAMPLE_ID=MMETSP1096 /ASSEMBLY_ACC=CAM_ASM_000453 /LENGTH=79 /DNA_ID=CAMNT_0023284673 /DNA_START=479 /DNA_END=718 /DNA_ORIENTATION=-
MQLTQCDSRPREHHVACYLAWAWTLHGVPSPDQQCKAYLAWACLPLISRRVPPSATGFTACTIATAQHDNPRGNLSKES